MAQSDFLDGLVTRLSRGEKDAETEVFQRYAARLIALARTRLDPRLKARVDPEDIVQSVFQSFFVRRDEGKFSFDDSGGLWAILVTMTIRKCHRKWEYHTALQRDVRRETAPPAAREGESTIAFEPPCPEPTLEEAAALSEMLEQLMARLDERGRQVLTLRLQGHTIPQISDQVGRSERTVHRLLDDIRALLPS
jgi:RNA polymerase sigma-70 factor (ECF subfamily)